MSGFHSWCNKGHGIAILYVGCCILKTPVANGKQYHVRSLSHCLCGPQLYVPRHITVYKNVLSASLNKTLPSSFQNIITIINDKLI